MDDSEKNQPEDKLLPLGLVTESEFDDHQTTTIDLEWRSHPTNSEDSSVSVMEDTQLVQFVNTEGFEPSDPSSLPISSRSISFLEDMGVVHIPTTGEPGSPLQVVRVLRVPVSVLSSTLSPLALNNTARSDVDGQSLLNVSLVNPSQVEIKDKTEHYQSEPKTEDIRQSQPNIVDSEARQTCELDDSVTVANSIASVVKTKKRSTTEKFLRLKSMKQNILNSFRKQEEPPPPLPEQDNEVSEHEIYPSDRCANCLTIFGVDEEKCSTVSDDRGDTRDTMKLSNDENEDKQLTNKDVKVVEALHLVFQILYDNEVFEECYLCKTCARLLSVLYSAFKAYTDLTKEEAYVRSKLKEIEKLSVRRKSGRRRGKTPKKEVDPLDIGSTAIGYGLVSSEGIKAEIVEWDDDDEDQFLASNLSDDDDFQASPSDLAAVGVQSSSSSSDEEAYVPVKKKKLHEIKKSKKSRAALSENFTWKNDDVKEDWITSDDDFGHLKKLKKRVRKSRERKSILDDLTYVCSLCDQRFVKPRELKRHLQDFHKKTHRTVDFQDDDGISDHIIATESEDLTKEKSDVFVCRLCFKEMLSRNALKEHFSAEHEGELPFICFKCDKTFDEEMLLKRHELSHNAENPYKCQFQLCRKSFRRADELRVHFRNEHVYGKEGEGGNEEDAKKSSPRKYRCKSEKAIVPCDVCGKTFVRHDHLKLHMRIHTGEKPYHCGLCDKAFSDPRGLSYHEVTHSNDRPYCCTICGLRFKRLHHLNDHERNHREDIERPFSCEVCGKCFKYKKHLNSHMLIHGNTKAHHCEICAKAFNRKDNLRQHVKKVHGKEPGPSTMSFTDTTTSPTASSTTCSTTVITQTIPIDVVSVEQIVYMHL